MKYTEIIDSYSIWVILKIVFSGFLSFTASDLSSLISVFQIRVSLSIPSTIPVYLWFDCLQIPSLVYTFLCAVLLPHFQIPWGRLSHGQLALLRVPYSRKSRWGMDYWGKVRAIHILEDYLPLAEITNVHANPAAYQSYLFWAMTLLVEHKLQFLGGTTNGPFLRQIPTGW